MYTISNLQSIKATVFFLGLLIFTVMSNIRGGEKKFNVMSNIGGVKEREGGKGLIKASCFFYG